MPTLTRAKLSGLLVILLTAACGDVPTESPATADDAVLAAAAMNDAGIVALASGSAHLQFFPPPGFGLRRLTFTAQESWNGDTKGEWQIVAGATILHGDLDCLTISPDGRSARISGIVTNARFTTFLPNTAFAMEVRDNGAGRSGDPDQTTSLLAFRNAAPEVGRAYCETGETPVQLEPMDILHGNFTVKRIN